MRCCFNPRAPCGARPGLYSISIHSAQFQSTRPMRGATAGNKLPAELSAFQSTRPMRGATEVATGLTAGAEFQSTRPMRGATGRCGTAYGGAGVSIHAPHAGRDAFPKALAQINEEFQSTRPMRGATFRCGFASSEQRRFQSTRPMRGATLRFVLDNNDLDVSIHAPHAGRDALLTSLRVPTSVSIHAPHAGRDFCEVGGTRWKSSFNPRAPCGARPPVRFLDDVSDEFQSTRPMRGAT